MADETEDDALVIPDPPGIGVWAAQFGSGQHRFSFVPAERASQLQLYDRAAGVLLRELSGKVLLSALWLYPPGDGAATTPRTETFMLHLVLRRGHDDDRLETEYDRLARAVIGELADTSEPAWPGP